AAWRGPGWRGAASSRWRPPGAPRPAGGELHLGTHHARPRQLPPDQQVADRDQGGAGQQEQPAVQGGQPQPQRGPHRIRYPTPGTVSITGGSPSLPRSVITVIRTLLVNGAACSSHAFSSSRSALTTAPSACSSTSSTANSLRDSGRKRPCRLAWCSGTSSVTPARCSTGGSAGRTRRPSAWIRAT